MFGIPGEENLDLLESLRTSDIKLILTRHEQAAGFMAATYGRHTGKTGVCLVVPGPGLLNATAALSTAYACNSPVLCVTGQIQYVDCGFNIIGMHVDDEPAATA